MRDLVETLKRYNWELPQAFQPEDQKDAQEQQTLKQLKELGEHDGYHAFS